MVNATFDEPEARGRCHAGEKQLCPPFVALDFATRDGGSAYITAHYHGPEALRKLAQVALEMANQLEAALPQRCPNLPPEDEHPVAQLARAMPDMGPY